MCSSPGSGDCLYRFQSGNKYYLWNPTEGAIWEIVTSMDLVEIVTEIDKPRLGSLEIAKVYQVSSGIIRCFSRTRSMHTQMFAYFWTSSLCCKRKPQPYTAGFMPSLFFAHGLTPKSRSFVTYILRPCCTARWRFEFPCASI
jgi:hypothetical protein